MQIEFGRSVEHSSIETAIRLFREALELLPVYARQDEILFGLSDALITQFHLSGHSADLEEADALLQKALELRAHPDPGRFRYGVSRLATLRLKFSVENNRAVFLSGLQTFLLIQDEDKEAKELDETSGLYMRKFQDSAAKTDLDTAISLAQHSVMLRPAPHPCRSWSIISLANALCTRFEWENKLSDLEEGIKLHREALNLHPPAHPYRSMSLVNLASALSTRFENEGQLTDLEEAIALHREALKLHASDPHRSVSLINLANALSARFNQKGQLADLDEAIALNQERLNLCPAPL